MKNPLALLLPLLLLSWLAAAAEAPSTGSASGVIGSSEKMLSFRHERAVWETPAGALHALVNLGDREDGALTLVSRSAPGEAWQQRWSLADTDAGSTSDGRLDGTTLQVVYNDVDAAIRFRTVTVGGGGWQVGEPVAVFAETAARADRATLEQDAFGRLWCAYTFVTAGSYRIGVSYSDDGGRSWQRSPALFGRANGGNGKAARLVALPDRIGMVYTDSRVAADGRELGQRRWAWRLLSAPVDGAWQDGAIGNLGDNSHDPFGTNFSAIADDLGDVHLFSSHAGRLTYMRYRGATAAWGRLRYLSPADKVAYMQAAVSADGRLLVGYNRRGYAEVLASDDGGDTFALLGRLTAIDGVDGSIGYPRVALPPLVTGSLLTLLRQYELPDLQSYGFATLDLPL